MAQRTQRAKKHTARLKAAARARRMLNLKRKGEKLIAMNVLRALASSNLPPEKICLCRSTERIRGCVDAPREAQSGK
jgi:hypothetical protein